MDLSNDQLFIISNVKKDQMKLVNTVVLTNFNLPSGILLRQNNYLQVKIPFVYNTEQELQGSKIMKRIRKKN